MPTLNFNVKVKAGPRTPAEVGAYYTAVNSKQITLVNGETVSGAQIAQWLRDNLQAAMDKLQGGSMPRRPDDSMSINHRVVDRWGGSAVVGLFGEHHHAQKFADQYDGFETEKVPR